MAWSSRAHERERQGGEALLPRKAPIAALLPTQRQREDREAREHFCRYLLINHSYLYFLILL